MAEILSEAEARNIVASVNYSDLDIVPEYLIDPDFEVPLKTFLAFASGRDGTSLGEADRVYNQYYWFTVFRHRFEAKHGFDYGIEQQQGMILSGAQVEFDWNEIEAIESLASGI